MRRQKPAFAIVPLMVILLVVGSTAGAATGMIEMLNLTGARQAAMGETAALFDQDPFNLEYNPATIIGLERGRLGFSYNSFFQDRNTSTLAAIFPARGLDFGIHLRLSGIDDIEARGDIPTSEPDYLFSSHDFSLKLFSAMNLTPQLKAGISVGWLMEKIDIHRGHSPAFGLGAVYEFKNGLMAHVSASNLGPKFTLLNVDNDLPSIYRAGASYGISGAVISADYVNVKSGDSHLHLGGEYKIEKYLFLRGGYQTGYDSRDISAGAGFVYNSLRIDYAFVPYKSDLGNSHRFTLNILLR